MATSKTVRRRRRSGRPRKSLEPREPNGQRQRPSTRDAEAEIKSVVLEARIRRGEATDLRDASDQNIADALGRAYRGGAIDEKQLQAGRDYAKAYAAHLAAISAPPLHIMGRKAAAAVTDDPEAKQRARLRWQKMRAAATLSGYDAYLALERVAIRDMDCRHTDAAALRFALNRILRILQKEG